LRIRLPQLWRHALPGLGNLWLVLLKDTSLAAVLALDELMRVAKVAGEVTRLPLVTFAAAAVIYLALTAISDHGRDWLERRAQRGRA
jgi:ABC-type arginine transport system permease subunit